MQSNVLLLTLAVCWSAWSAESVPSISPTDRVIPLFNGTNLHGFYSWLVDAHRDDPRRVFSVTNGMIRISGDGLGYLATDRAYRDYRLVVEFKWGKRNWVWGDRIGKARDSGIFLHAVGPDGNSHDGRGAFMAAIECNLFQGATGDLLLIRGHAADASLISPRLAVEVAEQHDADGWFTWRKGGQRQALETWGRVNWSEKDPQWRDVLDFRGTHDVESPPGEWTRVECVCYQDGITIKVNGVTVNEATDVFPRNGKILLQCEGSEIFFRRVELHPLEARERFMNAQKFIGIGGVKPRRSGMNAALRSTGFSPFQRLQASRISVNFGASI